MHGKIRSYAEPQLCRLTDVGETDITVEFDVPSIRTLPGPETRIV